MASNRVKKRVAKVPSRYVQDNLLTTSSKVSKWFTVLCLVDNKEYICTAKELETQEGLEINEDKVKRDDVLLWYYKGSAYEAAILDIHDKKPLPGSTSGRSTSKQKFVEDSSSDDDMQAAQMSKKRKTVKTKQRNDYDEPSILVNSDNSESEDDALILRQQQRQHHTKSVSKSSKSNAKAHSISDNCLSEDDIHILNNQQQHHSKSSGPSDKVVPRFKGHHVQGRGLSQSSIGLKLTSMVSPVKVTSENTNGLDTCAKLDKDDACDSSPLSTSTPRKPHVKVPESSGINNLKIVLQKMSTLERKLDMVLSVINCHQFTSTVTSTSTAEPSKSLLNEESNSTIHDGHTDDKYVTEQGVNLLHIRALNPNKYALACVDALFTEDEMARCCYSATSKSKKPPLPQDKISLLEECVDKKFGQGSMATNGQSIRKKINQKCIDTYNKKVKKLVEVDNKENKQ